tara:strand:- start:278 stop:583 length:306 start_codon:yes stop_codon:yes gene_type:complete
MVAWAYILGAVIVTGLVLIKFVDVRHRIKFYLVTILLTFGILSTGYVYLTNDIQLNSFEGWLSAGKLYLSFISALGNNLIKISGYAVQQDWGVNVTNTTLG